MSGAKADEFARHMRQSCLFRSGTPNLQVPCKTKIVCTLGPETAEEDMIQKLVIFGMSVMRLNMSHCSHEFVRSSIGRLRAYLEATQATRTVGILLDLNGSKLRTGRLQNGSPVELCSGDAFTFVLTTDDSFVGDRHQVAAMLPYNNLKPGDKLFVDDGLICLTVKQVHTDSTVRVDCVVDNNGTLGEHKAINITESNVSSSRLSVPGKPQPASLTAQDKRDIELGLDLGVDFIALSYIHSAEEIMEARKMLGDSRIKILAKIEHKNGLDQFDRILRVSDGIIIDRGYLGVEIDITRIAVIQKEIIHKCHLVGKPVILANQILEGMIKLPRPSRSESSDITSAVSDGTDAIILSGETSIGKYPLESLVWLRKICSEAENHIDYREYQQALIRAVPKPLSVSEAIACAAVKCATEIGAACIIVYTEGGGTARLVAKYRPNIPVVVTTNSALTARQVAMSFGVLSYFHPSTTGAESEDVLLQDTIRFVVSCGTAKKGDHVVITTGHFVGFQEGSTTNMRVHTIP